MCNKYFTKSLSTRHPSNPPYYHTTRHQFLNVLQLCCRPSIFNQAPLFPQHFVYSSIHPAFGSALFCNALTVSNALVPRRCYSMLYHSGIHAIMGIPPRGFRTEGAQEPRKPRRLHHLQRAQQRDMSNVESRPEAVCRARPPSPGNTGSGSPGLPNQHLLLVL